MHVLPAAHAHKLAPASSPSLAKHDHNAAMCDIDVDDVSDDLWAELTERCPSPVSSDLNASDTVEIARLDDDSSSDTRLCCRSTNSDQDGVDDACVWFIRGGAAGLCE